jgi:hypothetical protein
MTYEIDTYLERAYIDMIKKLCDDSDKLCMIKIRDGSNTFSIDVITGIGCTTLIDHCLPHQHVRMEAIFEAGKMIVRKRNMMIRAKSLLQ